MRNEKSVEYPEEDLEITELDDSTKTIITGFKCHLDEIEKFLKEDALKQTKEGINRTFLWSSKKERRLLGYLTICVDAISLDKIRKEEMKQMGIRYKSLPALKIGRIGVHKDYCGRKLGSKMIAFAIKRALSVHRKAACRFLTLDSKNDENIPDTLKPLRFYKKNGFEVLKTREKSNTVHMFRDLIEVIRNEWPTISDIE